MNPGANNSVGLSGLPAGSSWSAYPSRSFGTASLKSSGCALAVLPIHGLGTHGLGLSHDVEEVLGSGVIQAALANLSDAKALRVLTPLRLSLSPYSTGMGCLDPETFHDVVHEIAGCVKSAGFERLLFVCTNPWSGEIVDAASRDVRVSLNLQTFVIELAGIGLHLHPASPDRVKAQAAASWLLGQLPQPEVSVAEEGPLDRTFRPGNWRGSHPVEPNSDLNGQAVLGAAARRLAGLFLEIIARPGLGPHQIPAPNQQAALVETPPEIERPSVYPSLRRFRYLPALTATEFEALTERENALVILPVGAIEQHGAHLPVGVDSYIGEGACNELSARLPIDLPVWFGPSFTLGKSNEHLDYPGTVSLSAKTLRRMLIAQIEALHELGFRRFAFLNTHGGNSAVLVYTIRELQGRLGIRVGMLRIPSDPELSPQESTWGFHAGEWETSVMLTLTPDLVQMEHAICHYPASLDDAGELRPENAPAIFSWMTRDIAPEGVMGDATVATADKGRRWFDRAMNEMLPQIVSLVED